MLESESGQRPSGTRTKALRRRGMAILAIFVLAAMTINAVAQAPAESSITVVLDAVPDDDQDFEFTTSGNPLPASFLLDDDQGFAGSPDPNTLDEAWTSALIPPSVPYSIALTQVAGWTLTNASCDNGDLPGSVTPDPGNNVTCTFVVQADPGTITVTKHVEDATGSAWSFDIAIDPVDVGVNSPQVVFGNGDGSGVATYEPLTLNRTYTISEPSLPGGWSQRSFTCGVADEDLVAAGYQVTITSAGQAIDCDIVNATVSSITVILDTVPDDDQDFEFMTSGNPLPASFLLDDDLGYAGSPDPNTLPEFWTSPLVPAGIQYAITQVPVAGWNLTNASCDNGDSPNAITPDPGGNVTCTFVNEALSITTTVTRAVPGLQRPWLAVLVVLLLSSGIALIRFGRRTQIRP